VVSGTAQAQKSQKRMMSPTQLLITTFYFAYLVATLHSPALAQATSQAKPEHDDVATFLQSEMRKRGIPGLQVAVVQNGKVVLLGAYGLANIEDSVPVSDHTLFPINSATKSFTGVAAMELVEDGKLDLAAPVSQYLDALPTGWRAVTIRQLLTHTSGIPNIVNPNTGKFITGAGGMRRGFKYKPSRWNSRQENGSAITRPTICC
jgi:CubicO group peptidase (beta-lactamase class C family)